MAFKPDTTGSPTIDNIKKKAEKQNENLTEEIQDLLKILVVSTDTNKS